MHCEGRSSIGIRAPNSVVYRDVDVRIWGTNDGSPALPPLPASLLGFELFLSHFPICLLLLQITYLAALSHARWEKE